MTKSKLSNLSESSEEIVIDASVLINLMAIGTIQAVLRNLNRSVVITNQAYMEVRRDSLANRVASEVIQPLEKQRLLIRRDVGAGQAQNIFNYLTNELPVVLGEGEAATIGMCQSLSLTAVIDDLEGRKMSQEYWNIPKVIGTMDLLGDDKMRSKFKHSEYQKLILNAAQYGRMYIPAEWGDWAEELLGETVAKALPGLARYYKLRKNR